MSKEQAAPETQGVTVELLATVDLGPEIAGLAGRQLRMRIATFAPGSVFGPLHDHIDRPGLVYILQGTITDHRDGVATEYGPGVGWPKDRQHAALAGESRHGAGGGDLGRYRQGGVSCGPPTGATQARQQAHTQARKQGIVIPRQWRRRLAAELRASGSAAVTAVVCGLA